MYCDGTINGVLKLVYNTCLPGDITEKNGKIWRFLPLGDPTVSMFAVRDSDGRLSLREKAAVEEWINSSLPFHAMRDHPVHSSPILAGLWGGNNDIIGHKVAQSLMQPTVKEISKVARGWNFSIYVFFVQLFVDTLNPCFAAVSRQ